MKRAIQHLHHEFQIENINKNYVHANVQASDKFVMRMNGLPREKKCLECFFKQLMQPWIQSKG